MEMYLNVDSRYTAHSMPQNMFDAWMVELETTNKRQIRKLVRGERNGVCAWGVYLDSLHISDASTEFSCLAGTIDVGFFKEVEHLNDVKHFSFKDIARVLKVLRVLGTHFHVQMI